VPALDYSSTPLWRKLGIAQGARVLLRGAPGDLALEALAPLPAGVRFLARRSRDLDVVVTFVTRGRELEGLDRLAASLSTAGRLWIAWPKKTSPVPTDLGFAEVQAAGLATGLVDTKSASITDAYQGLGFVRRLRDRPR
jgi:hypothetical protein